MENEPYDLATLLQMTETWLKKTISRLTASCFGTQLLS